ncbi:MAG: PilW family protein [Thermoguttaceae bacterium]
MPARRGFSLMELLVGAALLGALMAVCLQFFTAMAAQKELLRDRSRAVQLAANLMERLAEWPWDQLTPQHAAQFQQAEKVPEGLPNAQVEARITQLPGQPEAKQVTVLVHWQGRDGAPQGPVRLTAWRYRLTAK